jgi:aminoglycoside phosphotransferase (APT) family kinase protein
MIACLMEKRAGDYTGMAHIVMEYSNGSEEKSKIVTAPITADNLKRHVDECVAVLARLHRLKGTS